MPILAEGQPATLAELADDPASEPDASERIEIVRWPLDRLDDAIAQCEDAKTLIGLLWLARATQRLPPSM